MLFYWHFSPEVNVMPKSRRVNCLVLPHASYGPGTLRLNGKERNGSRPK